MANCIAASDSVVRLWGDDACFSTQVGKRTGWRDIETTHNAGYLLFGPYLPFCKGHYQIDVRGLVGLAGSADARFDVAVNGGKQILAEATLTEPDEAGYLVRLAIELTEDCTDLELRIWVNAASEVRVTLLEIALLASPAIDFAQTALKQTQQSQDNKVTTALSLERPLRMMLLGTCQSEVIANLIEVMAKEHIQIRSWIWVEHLRRRLISPDAELGEWLAESDLILLHREDDFCQWFEHRFPNLRFKIRYMPRIIFGAWHPDADFVEISQRGKLREALWGEPMRHYQSALTFYGWMQGMDVEQTLSLFAEDVYRQMGYFDCYDNWKAFLVAEGEKTGLPLSHLIDDWSRQGCWMHSFNHPKLFVLIDIARELMRREHIAIDETVDATTLIEDEFAHGPIWPIYPEIAAQYGLQGDYIFRGVGGIEMSLRALIEISFTRYAQYDRSRLSGYIYGAVRLDETLSGQMYDSVRFDMLPTYLANRTSTEITPRIKPVPANPYSDLPDYHFWRRAVERVTAEAVDPVVHTSVRLHKDRRIATAGSCFAQHISRALQQHGYPYFQTETGVGMGEAEAKQRNYGVYSARYGNIYTARQLLQLFDRAYGDFIPDESAWPREDGRLVDPFRPQIEPDGFEHPAVLEQSRAEHFSAVRELFETLDIFIFTLGLTEAWRNRRDGAVYPLAPGVVAGAMNPREHEFVNFNTLDVIGDLQAFINRLLQVNPKARMILTVSPVPLIATYEDKHVLEANTYSKSVLRAAAEEVCRRNTLCEYFPAYEMVTGHYNHGVWFEDDLRTIKAEGVEQVMRTFFRHYAGEHVDSADGGKSVRPIVNYAAIGAVVCEEAELDRSDNQL